MELLRFTTAGSVDDGKSTLIGRLLYDSKSIFEDQLEAVEEASRNRGNDEVNLALLTDGLRAEREQGITIDVAYRYFATPKRKFIIADTPGHIQYTRNMVTGASTADLAVLLVDARHGIMEQTVRHSYIASLLAIPEVVVCVNKMDLVDYSETVFNQICDDYRQMSSHLTLPSVTFIPISAKLGDNVVEASSHMPWYEGLPLLGFLETVPLRGAGRLPLRLPVQYVIRPIGGAHADFRGYAGRIACGTVQAGDRVRVYPSGLESTVKSVWLAEEELASASAPQSVTVCLTDEIDISRGSVLVAADAPQPSESQLLTVDVCWFMSPACAPGKRYIVRHATQEVQGVVKAFEFKVDIATQQRIYDVEQLVMNDIARLQLKTAQPLICDRYRDDRTMGSLIFIDPTTNNTVGVGMIVEP